MIDEVSIYNGALTAAEIQSHYKVVQPSPTVIQAVTSTDGDKVLVTFDRNMAALPTAPAGFSVTADGVIIL
jgi:uncharacterized protein (DUF2141 family)